MIEDDQTIKKTEVNGGDYPSKETDLTNQPKEENSNVEKPKCKNMEIKTIEFSINPWMIICVLILAWFLL